MFIEHRFTGLDVQGLFTSQYVFRPSCLLAVCGWCSQGWLLRLTSTPQKMQELIKARGECRALDKIRTFVGLVLQRFLSLLWHVLEQHFLLWMVSICLWYGAFLRLGRTVPCICGICPSPNPIQTSGQKGGEGYKDAARALSLLFVFGLLFSLFVCFFYVW